MHPVGIAVQLRWRHQRRRVRAAVTRAPSASVESVFGSSETSTESKDSKGSSVRDRMRDMLDGEKNEPSQEKPAATATPDRREGIPPQGIGSAGGTLSGQPEGGSGRNRQPRKAAGACPPAGPAAQPSIEQIGVEIEAVTQAEEPGPSGPGGVRGALPKRLTPLAVGSRAQPWSLFGYFLANQKVTPRRAGGQGIYIFSYVQA